MKISIDATDLIQKNILLIVLKEVYANVQRRVLARKESDSWRSLPTTKALADLVDMPTKAVRKILNQLEKKGLVESFADGGALHWKPKAASAAK